MAFKKQFNSSNDKLEAPNSPEKLEVEPSNEGRPHIGKLEKAPKWLIDNHYILSGYRIHFNTIKLTFRSLFMCHNESTNIWSHFLGVIMFVSFIFYIAFFVGGLSFIQPLDMVIDNFSDQHLQQCEMPFDLCPDCEQSWINEVEKVNPDVFTNKVSNMLEYTRDSQLYDSADTYLYNVITK